MILFLQHQRDREIQVLKSGFGSVDDIGRIHLVFLVILKTDCKFSFNLLVTILSFLTQLIVRINYYLKHCSYFILLYE